jgi:DNA-binding NarL/FixJ family response regulator
MIKLFIIEDHPVIVSGLRNMFRPSRDQVEITVTASCLDEALKHNCVDDFNIILLDLWLPEGDPEDNLKMLLKQFPGKPVVIYTSEQSFRWQQKMFKAGVAAYLVKNADKTTIKSTLDKVHNGEIVFTYAMGQYHAKKELLGPGNQTTFLTPEQQKVIAYLSEGLSLKQIADKQGRSISAIEKMLKQLRKQFDANTNVELIKILLLQMPR